MLQTVTNRDTERANHAIRAISKIAESASYAFSILGESSTPSASTINWLVLIGLRIYT